MSQPPNLPPRRLRIVFLFAVLFVLVASVLTAADLKLVATELEGHTFGCATFCTNCSTGLGYAYDPTVLEPSAGNFQVWVQGASVACSQGAVDTIVEYSESGGVVTRVGDVSPRDATGCSQYPLSCAASPDALRHANGDRILFYSLGNADCMRGRLAVVDDSTGSWSDPQAPFVFYPLCFEGTSAPKGTDDPCIRFGVARVAAIEDPTYYYLYLELTVDSDEISTNPSGDWLRWGIFVMRVLRQSTSPYIDFGTGNAELYNADANTWHDLPYDPTYGFYTELCDGGGGGGLGLLNLSSFSSWALVKGWSGLGDVTYSPRDAGYVLTYRKGGDPEVYYRHSTSPTFHGAATYVLDTSAITDPDIVTYSMPSLHPVANGAQYTLFFSNLVSGFGGSEIRAARVVHDDGTAPPPGADLFDSFSTDYWGVPGKPIEQGGVTWQGNNNFRAVSGYATGKNVATYAIGAVPISLSGVSEVRLEARLRQINPGYQVLVLSSSLDPYNTTANEALWLQYQKSGAWYLRFRRNGGTGTLASGGAPTGFAQGQTHDWRLVYEPSTRRLEAWFEGTLLGSGTVPYTPVITYAGFQGRAPSSSSNYRTVDGQIDNFTVFLD